ncbi:hypothetical protein VB773_22000 [Haloarculaceae archaeon H-GB2-1]|nr:hypothetical protein [Haloarculaceae archaeon H-GB1-1]MEA5389570.1 hypothetical protein [Haloarculaceae archaeon H-GB11]MEA5409977.1 hypothetical protein [Haloarculaceae archaeon H-GB2-1]
MSDVRNGDGTAEQTPATNPDWSDVTLPASLVDRVEDRLPRTDFDTAAEYVAFVLEETLARVEDGTDEDAESVGEAEVEKRLESLGYLE